MNKNKNNKENRSKSSGDSQTMASWWIIALICLAIGVSGLLTHNYYRHILSGDESSCVLSEYLNCDKVSQSRFASLSGIPISTIAGAFYVMVLTLLALPRLKFYSTKANVAFFISTVLTGVGALVSIVMAGIAVIEIQALCIYCTLLQAITVFVFIKLFFTWRLKSKTMIRSKLSLTSRNVFIPLIISLIMGVSFSGIGSFVLEANAMSIVVNATNSTDQYPTIGSTNLSNRRYFFDTSDSPSVGPVEASVEMIVFGDYNCGHCYNFEPIISKLRENFPEQLRVTFKFFPLDASCNPLLNSQQISTSCRAAKAAYAAHQKNLFEPYHHLLFEHFRDHSILRILAHAKEIGIEGKEEEQFISIMKSEAALTHIRRDIAEAADSGLKGTPTVFLNGFRYSDNGTNDVTTRYQSLRKEIQVLLQLRR